MAVVAQLVRVPDCGSVGRRFESDLPPERKQQLLLFLFSAVKNRSFSLLLFIANNHITNILQVIKKIFFNGLQPFPFFASYNEKAQNDSAFFFNILSF